MSVQSPHPSTSRDAPRPRPTSAPRVLGSVILLLFCPAAAVAAFVLIGGLQEPATYLAASLLQLVPLVPLLMLGRGWLHPTRVSRPSDAAPPLLLALAAALTLGLTLLRADGEGVRTSALPRIRSGTRHGVPFATDLLYLISVILGVLSLAAAAALITALIWHAAPVRRLRGRTEEFVERTAHTVLHPADGEIPEAEPGPRIVTRSGDTLWRRHLPPVSRALLLLSVVATPGSVLLFALARPFPLLADVLPLVAMLLPAAGVIWAVLASLWRRDEQLGIVRAALLRTLLLPPLSGVLFLPALLALLIPPVREGLVIGRMLSNVDDEIMPSDASALMWVLLTALLSLLVSLLGSLAVTVAVVMPVGALFMPQVLIGDNALSTAPEHRRRNIIAVRALVLLIVLVFVFSILITDAEPEDARFWVAMAVLAVMAALTWYVWRTQRVDHAKRRTQGTSALIPGPEDPAPSRGARSSEGAPAPSADHPPHERSSRETR